jgi:YD repeat-containing protein
MSEPRRFNIKVVVLGICIAVAVIAAIEMRARTEESGQTYVLEQRLYLARAFEEPLVPMGPTTADEDEALLRAISRYKSGDEASNFAMLDAFLKHYPHSAWRVALFTNEGLIDYRAGYFGRAIAAFAEAWRLGKDVEGLKQKALVDRAVGELIRMHSRLGHADQLADLLAEVNDRPLTGVAANWVSLAREALHKMRNNPGIAYLCGPMAVKNVLLTLHPDSPKAATLDAYRSGPHGVSFLTVARLATDVGLNYRMVYRKDPGDDLPLPAVVHWKVNHYAAIVGFEHGRYHVKDPTFGNANLWITPQVLAAESDGYYLIPADAGGPLWADVSEIQAKPIYGMGLTNTSDPFATTPEDTCACDRPIGGDAGMPVANALAMLVSLRITDTPLFYEPPVGPAINIRLTYNQKEATQPANFDYGNLGPLWSMSWLSYIQDDPQNPSAQVTHVYAGGGGTVVAGCGSWTCTLSKDIYGLVLSRSGEGVYTITYPDGRTDTYALNEPEGTNLRRVFLTSVTDPQGNGVTLGYDAQYRLTTLTDALGQVTTLQYEDATDPLKITSVTDPFGRSATFVYDSNGHLASITDAIGQTSTFAYGNSLAADFINSMTTPYGTSNFTYTESSSAVPYSYGTLYDRVLTLTDPLGYAQRVEYDDEAPGTSSGTDPEGCPPGGPQGWSCDNQWMQYRNTYYWSSANLRNPNDYTTAENFHWLHDNTDTSETSRVLESIKKPLRNRVWFNYPGQSAFHRSGTLARPSFVGRRLSSGVGQFQQYAYNSQGRITCDKDPVGRVTWFDYAANGIDLMAVKQGTGGNDCTSETHGTFDTTAQYTYNSQHQPLTYTDASGETTTYAYNASGQRIGLTNPLSETTTYDYDGSGYLTSVTCPEGGTQESFTYDAMGRVATTTDAGGVTLGYTWDNLNRPTMIAYPDGTTRQLGYDKLDLASVTDRLGHTTYYTHDAGRNRVAVESAGGAITFLGYDGAGNLTSLTDPDGNTTYWDYNANNQPVAKTYADGSVETYTYTSGAGWLDQVTDPLGQVTQYGYTTDGRVSSMAYQNAQVATPAVSLTYDPRYPRVTSMTDGTGTTTYSYGAIGTPGANRLETVTVPSPSATISYVYDALGRMSTRTLGSDTETFGYDALGRLVGNQNSLGDFTFGYLGDTDQVTSMSPRVAPSRSPTSILTIPMTDVWPRLGTTTPRIPRRASVTVPMPRIWPRG